MAKMRFFRIQSDRGNNNNNNKQQEQMDSTPAPQVTQSTTVVGR